jgi:hypothetical protein
MVIPDAQHQEQLAELRKGIMPCRFCGIDYLWDGNRHDPLKMAGVHTMLGESRHWNRGVRVAFGKIIRTIRPYVERIPWWVAPVYGIAMAGLALASGDPGLMFVVAAINAWALWRSGWRPLSRGKHDAG